MPQTSTGIGSAEAGGSALLWGAMVAAGSTTDAGAAMVGAEVGSMGRVGWARATAAGSTGTVGWAGGPIPAGAGPGAPAAAVGSGEGNGVAVGDCAADSARPVAIGSAGVGGEAGSGRARANGSAGVGGEAGGGMAAEGRAGLSIGVE